MGLSSVRESAFGLVIERIPTVTLEAVRAALAAHEKAPVLASSSRGRTTRVSWDETSDAVVKETPLGVLTRLGVRTTRAERAFRAGVHLVGAAVRVAEPLAWVIARGSAFSIARHVHGERLDAAVAAALARGDRARVHELAVNAATLAARMHAALVTHGDFKTQNLIVDSCDTIWLLDLDSARIHARPPALRWRARDLGALDAYGQRGTLRVGRRARAAALLSYAALANVDGAELGRATLARSRLKRVRWARG